MLEPLAQQLGIELAQGRAWTLLGDRGGVGEHRAVEGYRHGHADRQGRQQRQVDVDQIGTLRGGGQPAADGPAVGQIAQRRQREVGAFDEPQPLELALTAGAVMAAGQDRDLMAAQPEPAAGLQHVSGDTFARRQVIVGDQRQTHQAADPRRRPGCARAVPVLQK